MGTKLDNKVYRRGAAYSSAFSVLGKFTAFFLQLLVAYYFGADTGTDIYFYLIGIAILLGGLSQVLNTSILVPKAMLLRNQGYKRKEMEYHNTFVYTFSLVALLFMSAFLLIGGEEAAGWIMNFPQTEIKHYIRLYYLFFPLALLMIINMYLSEVIVSFNYFILGLIANFLLNLIGIITLVCAAAQWGDIALLMYSNLFAALLTFILLICFLKFRLKWKFSLVNFSLVPPESKSLLGLTVNQGVVIFATTFPFYLLSQYQPGMVTIVTYAIKITQAPLAFIQQFTSVLQIKINNLYGQRKLNEMYRTTFKTAWGLFLFMVVASLAIYLLRHAIAEGLYGLGKMPYEAMNTLAYLTGMLVFSMPFVAVSLACMKIYFTEQRIRAYVSIMLITNLLSCWGYQYAINRGGESGYALVYVLTEMAIMVWVIGGLLIGKEKRKKNGL